MTRFNAHILLIIAMLLALSIQQSRAETLRLDEHEIKAAYLYNFAKYVEWPAHTLPQENSPLTFCIIGKSPLNKLLESLSEKPIKNRQLKVKHLARIEDLVDCNILYINASMKAMLPQILSLSDRHPILTVSDATGFASLGGTIELLPIGEKIKFGINNGTARQSGLKISSHLLRLAVTVVE